MPAGMFKPTRGGFLARRTGRLWGALCQGRVLGFAISCDKPCISFQWMSQTEWLKETEAYSLPVRRPEVRNQGVSQAVLPPEPLERIPTWLFRLLVASDIPELPWLNHLVSASVFSWLLLCLLLSCL